MTKLVGLMRRNLWTVFAGALYISAQIFVFLHLNADPSATVSQTGSAFGDAVAWAHSARIRYLFGHWIRPDLDDWRPFYFVPLHTLAIFLGFKFYGLTLAGLRIIPFLFAQSMYICLLIITWNRFGRQPATWMAIFLAIFSPILAFSTSGSMDTVQVSLSLFGLTIFLIGETRQKWPYYLSSGLIIGFSTLYKISALLFPLVPLTYCMLNVVLGNDTLFAVIKNYWRRLLFFYLGVSVVVFFYATLWVIPHLDEIVYFTWRMHGIGGKVVMPWHLQKWVGNLLNLFNSEWGAPLDRTIFSFHSVWIFGAIFGTQVLLCTAQKKFRRTDILFLSVVLISVIQCIFFDMEWRRYFILFPWGILGLLYLIDFIATFNKVAFISPKKTNVPQWLFSGFCLYLLIVRQFYRIEFQDLQSHFLVISAILILSIAAWFLVLKYNAKWIIGLFIGVVLLSFFQNTHFTWDYFANPKYRIRDGAAAINQQLHNGVLLGAVEVGFFTRLESAYIGTFQGQTKPAGWLKDGLNFRDYVYANRLTMRSCRFLAIFDEIYPGFLNHFVLSSDYKTRYHSTVFFEKSGTFATRHLIIAASDKPAYVTDEFLLRFDTYGQPRLPVENKAILEIQKPQCMITEALNYSVGCPLRTDATTIKIYRAI